MENIKNPMTSGIALGNASTFGMPSSCATDFAFAAPISSAARTRQDVVTKGHLGLVAYVPGIHAWSPPIC